MSKKHAYFFFVGILASLCVHAQNTITYQCILRSNAQKDTLCDGRVMPVFGITNSLGAAAKIPAKILYCNEGDSVVLNTRSISQGDHHTIHLHGLDVDTRNDGDPATSFWLNHMEDTTYSFRATNAGTYIYHCHVADVVHVQMGMYGLIVVNAAGGAKTAWTGGPAFDKDYKWLTSEIDSVWHYHIPVHDPVVDTVNVPKYVPNYFLINGKCGTELASDDSIKINGAQGEKILMRLANIGFLSNRFIFPAWLNAQIIDSDGRPLPNAIVNDTCYIMPGERFSVLLQPAVQATANVEVDYLDMNTGTTVFMNLVPVNINGIIGIKENSLKNNAVLVYPNPSDNTISIDMPAQTGNYEVRIFNAIGQEVITTQATKNINTSALNLGIYFVHVSAPASPAYTAKFIKK
jgi:FtsP/CotA-like multicopper oxidase with cupredoxin domain